MNIFQRFISWAFHKYVDTPLLDLSGYEVELVAAADFAISEDEDDLIDEIDIMNRRLKHLLEPSFDNEIEKALYERRFHTLH